MRDMRYLPALIALHVLHALHLCYLRDTRYSTDRIALPLRARYVTLYRFDLSVELKADRVADAAFGWVRQTLNQLIIINN